MRKSLVLAGLLLLTAGFALAQKDFPTVETSPAFMYIRNNVDIGNSNTVNFNCVGGGGTIAYNFSSLVGIAADMGGCKVIGNTLGLNDKVDGNQFTFLFGPRITFRSSSPFRPFLDLGVGGDRINALCASIEVEGLVLLDSERGQHAEHGAEFRRGRLGLDHGVQLSPVIEIVFPSQERQGHGFGAHVNETMRDRLTGFGQRIHSVYTVSTCCSRFRKLVVEPTLSSKTADIFLPENARAST